MTKRPQPGNHPGLRRLIRDKVVRARTGRAYAGREPVRIESQIERLSKSCAYPSMGFAGLMKSSTQKDDAVIRERGQISP
jgi:hypothetical protein